MEGGVFCLLAFMFLKIEKWTRRMFALSGQRAARYSCTLGREDPLSGNGANYICMRVSDVSSALRRTPPSSRRRWVKSLRSNAVRIAPGCAWDRVDARAQVQGVRADSRPTCVMKVHGSLEYGTCTGIYEHPRGICPGFDERGLMRVGTDRLPRIKTALNGLSVGKPC